MMLSNCLPLQEILLQNLGKAKPLRTCIVTISLSHLTYPHLFNGSLLDRSHHDVHVIAMEMSVRVIPQHLDL